MRYGLRIIIECLVLASESAKYKNKKKIKNAPFYQKKSSEDSEDKTRHPIKILRQHFDSQFFPCFLLCFGCFVGCHILSRTDNFPLLPPYYISRLSAHPSNNKLKFHSHCIIHYTSPITYHTPHFTHCTSHIIYHKLQMIQFWKPEGHGSTIKSLHYT